MQDGGFARPMAAIDQPLAERYRRSRAATLALCEGLTAEDMAAQSMADASPVKWHLAHTSWFFDEFVLGPAWRGWRPDWAALYNSYYQSLGMPFARRERGLLTRPALAEILSWRRAIDEGVLARLEEDTEGLLAARVELGLQHEQQHQELILTDLKHLFAQNPLQPVYRAGALRAGVLAPHRWLRGREGPVETGATDAGFAYDNERPRHAVLLQPHELANRPVSNGEFRDFIGDAGYRRPEFWLADGWNLVCERRWNRPLYWSEDHASSFTLRGPLALDPNAPVCHLSFYEADAYARWAGARLPREAEWEAYAAALPVAGNFVESGALQPLAPVALESGGLQFFGDVWEWTASPYVGYPGFRAEAGSLGEYNGKFMCGQWVLRGGSCASPASHLRASYRNFFYPADRWQFSGLRLASDA